jgi:hypothetical protein
MWVVENDEEEYLREIRHDHDDGDCLCENNCNGYLNFP